MKSLTRGLCIAGTLALVSVIFSCLPRFDLDLWLPEMIRPALDHLKELELPRQTDTLEWLTRSRLEALNVSHCALPGHLSGLPSTLKVLLARDLRITKLRKLRVGLKGLDLRDCDLEQVKNLPDTIEWLAIGNDNTILSEVILPQALQKLEIKNMEPTTLDYRSNVVGLKVDGSPFSSWSGQLPVSLTRLTLVSTLLTELPSLPSSITILSLETNEHLKISRGLPPLLTSFSSEGIGLGDTRRLLSLKVLRVKSSILPENLPIQLEDLSFTFTGAQSPREPLALPDLPGLKRLAIINFIGKVTGLPKYLDELDITGTPEISLDSLPRVLRKLVIAGRSSVDYSALPRSLRVLDISGVEEIKNASAPLPNLNTLIYRSGSGDLPALNDGLEVLDVGDSPDLKMLPKRIPSTLTELRASNTGVTTLTMNHLQKLEALDFCQPEGPALLSLPPKLQGLRVSEGQLSNRITFPHDLSHLSIRSPQDCNDDEGLWHRWLDERRLRRE